LAEDITSIKASLSTGVTWSGITQDGVDYYSDDESTVPSLCIQSISSGDSNVTDMSYCSFDSESDADSFMPHRKHSKVSPRPSTEHWEFLDDVSVGSTTLETEDTTSSTRSYGAELPPTDWSDDASSVGSSDNSTTLIASGLGLPSP
jgi:hypothetical protein